MSEFSYQLGFSVNKQLPPISDPLVDVDFCSSTGAAQTPPTLRFQIAANATSSVEGVYSDCVSIGVGTGTVATTIVTSAPFGTNATASHVLLTETSGNTNAFATVMGLVGPSKMSISTIGPSGAILLRMPSSTGYGAFSSNAATTCTIQVTVIGE
jgi:hypothetical protein